MPRIPLYDRQIRPAESTSPFLESVERKGQEGAALSGLGQDLLAIGDRMMKERAIVEASSALSRAQDEERGFLQEELTREGTNAYDSQVRGIPFYEKLKTSHSAGLSQGATAIFNSRLDAIRNAGLDKLSVHEASQHQANKLQVVKNLSTGLSQRIIANQIMTRAELESDIGNATEIMRALYPGMDKSDVIAKFQEDQRVAWLMAQVRQNPSSTYALVDSFKGDLSEETLRKIAHDGQSAEAMRDLNADPERFEASKYKYLNADDQQRLQLNAFTMIRTNDERRERLAEKNRKRVIDRNDLMMWQKFFDGSLNLSELEDLASVQGVSESAYKGIKEKLIKGEKAQENNDIVVGDIAEKIELRDFEGARTLLEEAQGSQKIKTETYISMRKSLASEAYSDAQAFINKAMKPGEIEFDPWLSKKWADASADLATRAASGEKDLIGAAKNIVALNRDRLISSMSRYRKPRYLDGNKNDPGALQAAKQSTLKALNAGQITPREYNAEMELIDGIEKALVQIERNAATVGDIEKQSKEMKVGK